MKLQRMAGNRAVMGLMQLKPVVGPAHDPYEQEADRVAGQVISMPVTASIQRLEGGYKQPSRAMPLAVTIAPPVPYQEERGQHKPASSEEAFVPEADFESRLAAQQGRGERLPDATRAFMESRIGSDFSGVRMHTGSDAVQLNRAVSAKAFTHGQDIYLGAGKFNPKSKGGQYLLAHELAHVVQQSGGMAGKGLVQRTLEEDFIKKAKDANPGIRLTPANWFWQTQTSLAPLIECIKAYDNDPTNGRNIIKLANAKEKIPAEKKVKYATALDFLESQVRDLATCECKGMDHAETRSFALVESKAWMSNPTHRVIYDIKWTTPGVQPGGTHLGQDPNNPRASDWIVDKSKEGKPIGDRVPASPYFDDDQLSNQVQNGCHFFFPDGIEQRRLQGGSWFFRLRVVDKNGKELTRSADAQVNWGT